MQPMRLSKFNILKNCTLAAVAIALSFGCQGQSPRLHPGAVRQVNEGRFDTAREELRSHAADLNSPDVILDNHRLAVASIHDGALFEAGMAFNQAYPFMVSGQLNDSNRIASAKFTYESRLIWRGEPFEQAMAWYYQAVYQAILGDWENVRAASKNMLFQLADFASGASLDDAMSRAESPEWIDRYPERIESDLVMGYILLGLANRQLQRPADASDAFSHAATLAPHLAELLTTLETGTYDTLLFVEAGRGPEKVPVGKHGESFVYRPLPDRTPSGGGPLIVDVDRFGRVPIPAATSLVDTWALAQHPRWWSLASLRRLKASMGDIATIAGLIAITYGSSHGHVYSGSHGSGVHASSHGDDTDGGLLLVGLALIGLGQALAETAQADLRHLDVLPRQVHLVPLRLGPDTTPRRVVITAPAESQYAVRHYISPGTGRDPKAYTTRLHPGEPPPQAYTSAWPRVMHPNDVTGPIAGTYPYILGGTCVCTPTAEVLATYQAGGFLRDVTLSELEMLYQAERIGINRPLARKHDAYRHVLRGGHMMYTPHPGSSGFEHLTYTAALPYEPRSREVREMRARLGLVLAGESGPGSAVGEFFAPEPSGDVEHELRD